MTMLSPTMHYATFARLHYATNEDLGALCVLSDSLPGAQGSQRPVWTNLIHAKGAHVLVATECQLIVGAIVASLDNRNQVAFLSWLGVTPTARGRGVGRLMIATILDRMAVQGAREISVALPDDDHGLKPLLLDQGFVDAGSGIFRLPIRGRQT